MKFWLRLSLLATLFLTVVLGNAFYLRFFYDVRFGPNNVEVTAEPGKQVGVRLVRYGPEDPLRVDLKVSPSWGKTQESFYVSDSGGSINFDRNTDGLLGVELIGEPGGSIQVASGLTETKQLTVTAPNETVREVLEFDGKTSRKTVFLYLLSLVTAFFLARFLTAIGLRLIGEFGWVRVGLGILAAPLTGWLVIQLVPVPPPPITSFDLTVTSTVVPPADAPAIVKGDEFDLTSVRLHNGANQTIDPNRFKLLGDWQLEEGLWVAEEEGQSLRWRGLAPKTSAIEVEGPPAEVLVNGQTTRVSGRANLVDVAGNLDSRSRFLTLLSVASESLLIGLAFVLVLLLAVVGSSRLKPVEDWLPTSRFLLGPEPGVAKLTVFYGGALLAVWLAVLLVFWPGQMNIDAVVAISTVLDQNPNDWHPYLSSYLLTAITLGGGNFWLGLVLQNLLLAGFSGRFLAWVHVRGGSRYATVAVLLAAFNPVVALGFNTLSKDGIFHTGIVGLVLLTWRVVDTQGSWLARPLNLFWFYLVSMLVVISRHNGWPVVIGTILVLVLFGGGQKKRLGLLGGLLVASIVSINGPLSQALNVGAGPSEAIVLGTYIAAHEDAGTTFSSNERALLDKFALVDTGGNYKCSHNAHLVRFLLSQSEQEQVEELIPDLRSLVLKLSRRDPGVTWGHMTCASEVHWRINGSPDAKLKLNATSQVGDFVRYMEVRENDRFPTETPASPRAASLLISYLEGLPSALQRPPLYSYGLLIAGFVAAFRRRSWHPLVLIAPIAGEVASLIPVNISPHTRLQFSTFLLACLVVPALLAVKRRHQNNPDKRLTWESPPNSKETALTTPDEADELA